MIITGPSGTTAHSAFRSGDSSIMHLTDIRKAPSVVKAMTEKTSTTNCLVTNSIAEIHDVWKSYIPCNKSALTAIALQHGSEFRKINKETSRVVVKNIASLIHLRPDKRNETILKSNLVACQGLESANFALLRIVDRLLLGDLLDKEYAFNIEQDMWMVADEYVTTAKGEKATPPSRYNLRSRRKETKVREKPKWQLLQRNYHSFGLIITRRGASNQKTHFDELICCSKSRRKHSFSLLINVSQHPRKVFVRDEVSKNLVETFIPPFGAMIFNTLTEYGGSASERDDDQCCLFLHIDFREGAIRLANNQTFRFGNSPASQRHNAERCDEVHPKRQLLHPFAEWHY